MPLIVEAERRGYLHSCCILGWQVFMWIDCWAYESGGRYSFLARQGLLNSLLARDRAILESYQDLRVSVCHWENYRQNTSLVQCQSQISGDKRRWWVSLPNTEFSHWTEATWSNNRGCFSISEFISWMWAHIHVQVHIGLHKTRNLQCIFSMVIFTCASINDQINLGAMPLASRQTTTAHLGKSIMAASARKAHIKKTEDRYWSTVRLQCTWIRHVHVTCSSYPHTISLSSILVSTVHVHHKIFTFQSAIQRRRNVPYIKLSWVAAIPKLVSYTLAATVVPNTRSNLRTVISHN